MRKILFLNGFLCLFFLLMSGCGQDESKSKSGNSAANIKVVEAYGELASLKTAILSPSKVKGLWQYKITYLAPEGSLVKSEQPVIRFDSSALQQNFQVKSAELKTAEKQLENTKLDNEANLEKLKLDIAEAKMNFEKSKRKWEQAQIVDSKLETKKQEIEYKLSLNEFNRKKAILENSQKSALVKTSIAQSNVDRLNSEVQEISDGIKRLTVNSPKDGIVIYKADWNGNKVSIGDNVWFGRQILELPSLDEMIVKAQVLEVDAGKLELGQSVEVKVDSIPERTFSGKLVKLGQVFRKKSFEQPNVIFDAEVQITEAKTDLLRPGMTARIKIQLADG